MGTPVDMMAWASEWHHDLADAYLTQLVVYRVPGVGEVEVKARFGATRNQVENAQGVHFDITTRDFLIKVHDLVIDGDRHTPEPGDEVFWTDAHGEKHLWDVTNQFGEACCREHDRYGTTWRIHAEHCSNVFPSVPVVSGPGVITTGQTYELSIGVTRGVPEDWRIDWGDDVVETVTGDTEIAAHVYSGNPRTVEIAAVVSDAFGDHAADVIAVELLLEGSLVGDGDDPFVDDDGDYIIGD